MQKITSNLNIFEFPIIANKSITIPIMISLSDSAVLKTWPTQHTIISSSLTNGSVKIIHTQTHQRPFQSRNWIPSVFCKNWSTYKDQERWQLLLGQHKSAEAVKRLCIWLISSLLTAKSITRHVSSVTTAEEPSRFLLFLFFSNLCIFCCLFVFSLWIFARMFCFLRTLFIDKANLCIFCCRFNLFFLCGYLQESFVF